MCDGMSGGDEDDGGNKGCGVCGEGECSEDSSVDDWVARAKSLGVLWKNRTQIKACDTQEASGEV
jgi:hypothetical protein